MAILFILATTSSASRKGFILILYVGGHSKWWRTVCNCTIIPSHRQVMEKLSERDASLGGRNIFASRPRHPTFFLINHLLYTLYFGILSSGYNFQFLGEFRYTGKRFAAISVIPKVTVHISQWVAFAGTVSRPWWRNSFQLWIQHQDNKWIDIHELA